MQRFKCKVRFLYQLAIPILQGNIGQVDINSVLQNIEHLVPVIEEEPVSSMATAALETPISQPISSLQTTDVSNDQPLPTTESDKSDRVSREQPLSDQSQTISETKTDQQEPDSSKIENENNFDQSEELLQTPKVTFTTGSDTEEEGEPGSNVPDIDSIDLSNLNLEPVDSFNVNIDTDLSALAADVLTGHSSTQEEEEKKES